MMRGPYVGRGLCGSYSSFLNVCLSWVRSLGSFALLVFWSARGRKDLASLSRQDP